MANNNPFKGPESYGIDDAMRFYGREQEKSELLKLINQYPLTVLYSKSGLGKTSLINAGLVNQLLERNIFLPVVMTLPEESAMDIDSFLKNIISQIDIKMDELCLNCRDERFIEKGENYVLQYRFVKDTVDDYKNRSTSLFEFFHGTILTCTRAKLVESEPSGSQGSAKKEIIIGTHTVIPVLIFDQFEELFTKSLSRKFLFKLIDELSYLIEGRIPPYTQTCFDAIEAKLNSSDASVSSDNDHRYYYSLLDELSRGKGNFRVLFSFREEYLAQFEDIATVIPTIRNGYNRFSLKPFGKDTAVDVIGKIEPKIDKSLAGEIVATIQNKAIVSAFRDEQIEPFILSMFCYYLYEDNKGEWSKTKAKLAEGKNNILDKIAEEYCNSIFANFKPEVRLFIENNLVSIDSSGEHYRREPFPKDKMEASVSKNVLDQLLASRDVNSKAHQRFRFLKETDFQDVQNGTRYIIIMHDRLMIPLAKSRVAREAMESDRKILEARSEERERILKKTGAITLVITLISIVIYIFAEKKNSFRKEFEASRALYELSDFSNAYKHFGMHTNDLFNWDNLKDSFKTMAFFHFVGDDISTSTDKVGIYDAATHHFWCYHFNNTKGNFDQPDSLPGVNAAPNFIGADDYLILFKNIDSTDMNDTRRYFVLYKHSGKSFSRLDKFSDTVDFQGFACTINKNDTSIIYSKNYNIIKRNIYTGDSSVLYNYGISYFKNHNPRFITQFQLSWEEHDPGRVYLQFGDSLIIIPVDKKRSARVKSIPGAAYQQRDDTLLVLRKQTVNYYEPTYAYYYKIDSNEVSGQSDSILFIMDNSRIPPNPQHPYFQSRNEIGTILNFALSKGDKNTAKHTLQKGSNLDGSKKFTINIDSTPNVINFIFSNEKKGAKPITTTVPLYLVYQIKVTNDGFYIIYQEQKDGPLALGILKDVDGKIERRFINRDWDFSADPFIDRPEKDGLQYFRFAKHGHCDSHEAAFALKPNMFDDITEQLYSTK